MKSLLTFTVLAAAILGFATHSLAAAIVVYSDDFTDGLNSSLNGQAPQVRPTTETWAAGNWTKNTSGDGTVTHGGGTSSAVLPAPSFNPGDIFVMTTRLFNDTTGSGWTATGFTTGTTTGFNSPNVGMYWMLWRGNDELRALENGASFVGPSVVVAGENNQLDARIVFDVDENTMTWFYKNPSATDWIQLHSMTPLASRIASINNLGLSANTGSAGAISFEFTNAIPEPGTALLCALGLLTLLGRRRRLP